MTDTKKSRTGAWLLFLVSLAAMVLLLMFAPQWFWTSLPGTFTGLVLLMDWV